VRSEVVQTMAHPPAGSLFPALMVSGMNWTMDRTPDPRQDIQAVTGLLDRVSSGDRDALADLYDRTSAKLFGICLRILSSESDAEDALQEVYVTVWRKADRFDSGKASPITWLSVLARNKAIDRLRRRRVTAASLDEASEVPDDAPSAFDIVQQGIETQRLAGCLDELDAKPRAMIRAAFIEGATYSELATRESVPLGTMKSWIRRALLRLRGCLER
jgi:RNA polymerase sigma factor (sigma-70 family)